MKITLEFEVKNMDINPDVMAFLNHDTWNDGRHSQSIELLALALHLLVKEAGSHSILQEMIRKYGNEWVQKENGGYNRAYHEASLAPAPRPWVEQDTFRFKSEVPEADEQLRIQGPVASYDLSN